jgi:hypothetical protein
LHVALERSSPNTDMVKLLIKHGADVNFLHHVTTKSRGIELIGERKTTTGMLKLFRSCSMLVLALKLKTILVRLLCKLQSCTRSKLLV